MLRGRRGPIVAGIAVIAVVVIAVLFLVLPKLGQVRDADAKLDDAKVEEATLSSQLAALKQAETDAPEAREQIAAVERAIPPIADLSGFILLLDRAADSAGVDPFTVTPGAPVFDANTGLTQIPVLVTANGTYFSLAEFLFQIETLPRVAKVTTLTVAPTDKGFGLSMTSSVSIYTSDASAGPGSSPGPTEASQTSGSTTTTTTTTAGSTPPPAG